MKSRLFFRNWWRIQNYHHNARRKSLKSPPPSYIGNQTALLSDPDYLILGAAERGHLHGMLLLAASDGGHIPVDPRSIATCLRVDGEIDLSPFGEWLVKCEDECEHYPEGFDNKGHRRRGHGVGTASRSDPDKEKGKGKGKVKEKRSTASSEAPISPVGSDLVPGDDDAVEKPPSGVPVDLNPTAPVDPNGSPEDPIGQVMAFLEEAGIVATNDRDRDQASHLLLRGYTVQQITGGITLGLHRAERAGSKVGSLAYFTGVIQEVARAGGGYGKHLARRGLQRAADGMEKPDETRNGG